ncbi:hotdog family protein [Shewanella sp. Isolate11]|uniref:hotdog family protein n=1 Tax=Shewanella sp. Isolate11 TaxID=2908530 RepID=UPI001EFD72C2|nr:hotdog family protein [Shewanella sp. Isolate11]MCG9697841.1 hotdog family protein [Shewanella sp. Isolate11]
MNQCITDSTQANCDNAALNVTALDVAEVIPHRAPMILIDRLLAHQTDTLLTETHISTSSAYFDAQSQSVPNYVGIEYMAQSIAALAGVEAIAKQQAIKIGFLLGSRKLKLHIPAFALGESYQTRVSRLYQEESGLAVFDCQILHHDQIVAEANINVFQPQDTDAYISESIQGSEDIPS